MEEVLKVLLKEKEEYEILQKKNEVNPIRLREIYYGGFFKVLKRFNCI
jgi:hypothetical protein